MEAEAIRAHEYYKQYKKHLVQEHKTINSKERGCKGLTNREWFMISTKQKSSFSKGKKFAHSKLWNHNHVPTEEGFSSLKINIK